MSDTCPTCKVKADNEQGFVIINVSDFDAKVHEHFDVEDKPRAKPGPKPKAKE